MLIPSKLNTQKCKNSAHVMIYFFVLTKYCIHAGWLDSVWSQSLKFLGAIFVTCLLVGGSAESALFLQISAK